MIATLTGKGRRYHRGSSFLPQASATIDALIDGGFVAFAGWTIIYEIGLATQWPLFIPGLIWFVASLAVVAVWLFRRRPWSGATSDEGERSSGLSPLTLADLAIVVVSGVLVAIGVVFYERLGVVPLAVVGTVSLSLQLLRGRRAHPVRENSSSVDRVNEPSSVIPLTVSCLLGVLALFLVKPDSDDVYYVNRATWIAEHGIATLQDTIFSAGKLPPIYPGLPLASIEALQGVLARWAGVEAATMAYLVFAPAVSFALGWVTWRLIKQWAPRREVLVFVVAISFIVLSGASITGNYSVGRMWQGKVMAIAVLFPAVWFHLSRLIEARGTQARRHIFLLGAMGVAFVGLTTSASLLAPVITAVGLLAAVMTASKNLAKGALAFLAGPMVAGVVVVLYGGRVDGVDAERVTGEFVLRLVFGLSVPMVVLAMAALVWAGQGTRTAARPLVMSLGLVPFVALLPGVLPLVGLATGADAVGWRLLTVVPLSVFVGLLVCVPRVSSASVSTALALCLVAIASLAGTPVWSHDIGATVSSRPEWKVDHTALTDLRKLQALSPPQAGRWLLPKNQMEILALSRVRPHAVVPRDFYAKAVDVSAREQHHRWALWALELRQPVSAAKVRKSLDQLRVSVACVPNSWDREVKLLGRVTGTEPTDVGSMACSFRPTGKPAFDWIAP